MKKLLLTTALVATSIFTLSSCGGSEELTIFLHQDGVIYNSDMKIKKKSVCAPSLDTITEVMEHSQKGT